MKNKFVRTQNVKNFIGLIENLKVKPQNIPKMGLVYGGPGLGKLQTALCKKPKIIIIDEMEYLLGDNKTVETLRDIHDKTDSPIIFVGMGLAHKKLERHKHLYDSISEIVKFETFKIADIKEILSELSEIEFTPDAIELLLKKQNRFRQIVQTINQLEIIAKDNELTEITAKTLEAVL